MADVYLGSVYASLELKTNNLKSQLNHAESMFSGLDSAAAKSGSTGETAANKMAAAFGAVAGVVQSVTTRAFDALTSSIDGGIKRFDTMNNFPKVMQNVGVSTEQSAAIIEDLSEKLKGLPTSLDAGAAAVQRFTMTTKDVQKSEDWFLALNDAILSGGASMDLQATALEQFTQMIAVGKPDMMAWRSVIRAMPAQMDMLARSMGYVSGEAGGDLYDAFLKGKVSANDLMNAMVKLDKEGSEGIRAFKDTAFDATGGISTQLANLKNAMNRFWQTVFTSIGSDNIRTVLQGLYDGIGKLAKVVGNFVSKVMPPMMNMLNKVGPAFEKLLDVLGNILSSQAVEFVITAIANALGFLADVLSKIPTEVLSTLIMGFVAFKQVNKFLPIMKGLGSVLGNLGSKFKLFNGAEKLGKGVGSAIAAVLKPLGSTEVLKGAASADIASAGLVLIAIAIDKAMKIDYDLGKLVTFAACVTAAAGIMALIGTFGQYAMIGGIATAVIGGGLLVAAEGLKAASEAAKVIDFGALMLFSGELTLVSGIMAAIGLWGAFSAIGAIASAVIGGGLMVAAKGLAEASKSVKEINMSEIERFSGMIAKVSAILGAVSALSVYGAVGAIADAIIGGGLMVAAMALAEASKSVKNIDMAEIEKFSGMIAKVSAILGAISVLSVFGAVGAIADTIISGGILVSALALAEATKHIREIDEGQIDKFNDIIAKTGAVLSGLSFLSAFSTVGAIATTVISGGVLVAAKALYEAMFYAKKLSDNDMDTLGRILEKIASWQTGGLLASLEKMISSAALTVTARNIKDIVKTLAHLEPLDDAVIDSLKGNIKNLSELETSGVLESIGDMWASGNLREVADNVSAIIKKLAKLPELPDNGKIDQLKEVIHNLSQIKIEGSGLFENNGAAAQELEWIVSNIVSISHKLSEIPQIKYNRISNFVDCLKLFDRIDDKARDGIKRLSDLGDSLGNIDWIKKILGDIPKEIGDNVQKFVNAIKKFNQIDDGTRDGVRRLKDLGDSLSNIDWIKKILGDVPDSIGNNVDKFVSAIKKFNDIDQGTRDGIRKLKDLGDSLGNISWIKAIIGDIPDSIGGNVDKFVQAIKKFNDIDEDTRKGIRSLNDLGDGLGNIDWTKHIIGDIPDSIGNNVDSFVKAIKKFNDIDEGTRKSVRELNNLGDSLGNIDWLKKILGDVPEGMDKNIGGFVNAIKKFGEIDDNARNGALRLKNMGDSLGNIDWLKHILGDMPEDIYGKVQWFVDSINLFDRIDENARAGVLRLASLSDSLGNIDWIKHILGDLPTDIYGKVQWFVDAIKLFDRIDENARAGVMRLASLSDALGNIDWIKHILGDIPDGIAEKAGNLVEAIKKFNGISLDGDTIANVANALNNLMNTVKTSMDNIANQMQTSGQQSAQRLIQGIQSKFGDARQQGIAMGNKFKEGLSSVNNSLMQVGQAAQGAYWRGIQGKMNDEYQQGKAMGLQFRQGLYDVDYGNAGYWAVVGFKNGAWSQDPYSTGWQIANRFLQGLKDRGQQGSPWRTTFQSGVWAGEGFADGILKSESMVENAANKIADVAISAMNMDDMGNMMVSPDMSSVSASMAQVIGKIEAGDKDRGSETNIYGDIYITPNGDDEDVLDELSRATSMVDRGMATRV